VNRLTVAILACAAVPLAASPTAATAASAQQTLTELNAQRAANGIPAGITENPTWSSDCQMHDAYMAMNGGTLTHMEVATNPGWSNGGAFAGMNSVLAKGTSWDAGNPYERAPLHLDQLLAPRLDVLGSADYDAFSCTTTFPGWTRAAPAALTIYTYPGSGASIYPSEVTDELPFTPGTLVGLRPRAKTGPNLFVFADAPGQGASDNPATLSQAMLTGPSGTVSVDMVDGNTAVPGGPSSGCPSGTLSCYIAPGGFIIPVAPLQAGSTYHAHVVVGFAGAQTAHDWTFTTQGVDPNSHLTLTGRSLHFKSNSPAPIRVTFTRASGAHAATRVIAPGRRYRLHLNPGSWQACGHQLATGSFTAFDECLSILVTGVPKLQFGRPRVDHQQVKFPVTFTSVLRGRSATLTITPLTFSCVSGSCSTTAGTPTTRAIVLRANSIKLPLPAKGQGFRLMLATAAFQQRDAPWLAAHTVSRAFVRR
jgi:hypothetical protein